MTEAASVRNELEKSRRDVLDLSLRNPLLNFRPSKRRGLEVVDELSRELFQILVRAERVMYFLPAPEGEGHAGAGAAGQGPLPSTQTKQTKHHPMSPPNSWPSLPNLRKTQPEPPPATPTTSYRPRSPSPASTSASARPSGRPASPSRSRASTSSTSPWGCSGGTSPTAAPPNVARRWY